ERQREVLQRELLASIPFVRLKAEGPNDFRDGPTSQPIRVSPKAGCHAMRRGKPDIAYLEVVPFPVRRTPQIRFIDHMYRRQSPEHALWRSVPRPGPDLLLLRLGQRLKLGFGGPEPQFAIKPEGS